MQSQLLNSAANIGVISIIVTEATLRSSWVAAGVRVASTHIRRVGASHAFATGACATLEGPRPTTAAGTSAGRTGSVAWSPAYSFDLAALRAGRLQVADLKRRSRGGAPSDDAHDTCLCGRHFRCAGPREGKRNPARGRLGGRGRGRRAAVGAAAGGRTRCLGHGGPWDTREAEQRGPCPWEGDGAVSCHSVTAMACLVPRAPRPGAVQPDDMETHRPAGRPARPHGGCRPCVPPPLPLLSPRPRVLCVLHCPSGSRQSPHILRCAPSERGSWHAATAARSGGLSRSEPVQARPPGTELSRHSARHLAPKVCRGGGHVLPRKPLTHSSPETRRLLSLGVWK